MKIVDIKELNILRKLNKGTFCNVYLVEFDGKQYCYKEIVYSYADDKSMVKLCDLTEQSFDKQFIVPEFMVFVSARCLFTGYLSKYDPNLVSIFNPFSREEKIKLLRSVRNNIEELHKNYNIIHGDLHLKNILCHKYNLETALIDFDFSQMYGEVPSNFSNYGIAMQNYVKKFLFDFNADIYYFNLSTFMLLAEIERGSYDDLMSTIFKGQYYFSEMNNDVKYLIKELTLEDTRKSYSGKYIIDYI